MSDERRTREPSRRGGGLFNPFIILPRPEFRTVSEPEKGWTGTPGRVSWTRLSAWRKALEGILKAFAVWFGGPEFRQILFRVLVSLALIVALLGLRKLVFAYVFRHHIEDQFRNRVRWKRNTTYFLLVIAVFVLFPIWLPSIQNILTVLGIFGAGVLIVLKEVFLNVAGWFYIVVRRPFEEGNRITIGDRIGDVIDIRVMDVTLLEVRAREDGGQSTGRVLHIPPGLLFTQPVSNASKEFSFNWNEIEIPLTARSDWKLAVSIVRQIAESDLEDVHETDQRIQKSRRQYEIRFANLKPGVFVDFRAGAIVLTLRHLIEPRRIRISTDLIWRKILERFANHESIELKE